MPARCCAGIGRPARRCLSDSPKPDSPKLGFRVKVRLRVRVRVSVSANRDWTNRTNRSSPWSSTRAYCSSRVTAWCGRISSPRIRDVSRHDSRVFWGHLHQTYNLLSTQLHSLHRQTLLLVGFHAAPERFGTVFPHLYALLIVSLVLGLSSITCSQDICSRSAIRASDWYPLPGLSRVINSSLTYLLTRGGIRDGLQSPAHEIFGYSC